MERGLTFKLASQSNVCLLVRGAILTIVLSGPMSSLGSSRHQRYRESAATLQLKNKQAKFLGDSTVLTKSQGLKLCGLCQVWRRCTKLGRPWRTGRNSRASASVKLPLPRTNCSSSVAEGRSSFPMSFRCLFLLQHSEQESLVLSCAELPCLQMLVLCGVHASGQPDNIHWRRMPVGK